MHVAHQRCGGREDCFDRSADGTATAGWVDPLLFLSAVTEPYSDHLFLHVELVRDHGDLLRGRFWVLLEKGKSTRNALTAKTNHKDLQAFSPWSEEVIIQLETFKLRQNQMFKQETLVP